MILRRHQMGTVSRWSVAAALAALMVLGAFEGGGDRVDTEQRAFRSGGDARLVFIQPLPVMQNGLCLTPAGGGLMAATLGVLAAEPTTVVKNPLRIIKDPYSAFSSVAVDLKNNEAVATDENNFQILVYDRLDNTPPQAAMTEPRRVIAGPRTDIEFQCGLYIDQNTGDIYAVNNDTQDKLVIFSRQAEGNVPPDRWLATPHGTFGIAVDEKNQELFLTVQHDSALVVYEKMASEEEAPLRLLQGHRTRLADPHGVAVDNERDLIYVANYGSTHDVAPRDQVPDLPVNWPVGRRHAIPGSGRFHSPSINVYPRTAQGNVPPLRVIEGPRTQLNWPTGLAYYAQRNEIYVSNDMSNSILVFDADADGNVAPVRSLKGPRTGLDNPTGIFLDTVNNELWVANFGAHSLTVYDIAADGDAPPLRTIRSALPGKPSLMIGNPGAVGYDSKRKEILVPN